MGFTTFPKIMLLASLVLQHVKKKQLLKHLTVDISKKKHCWNHWFYNLAQNKVAKQNGRLTLKRTVLVKPILSGTIC